MIRIDMDMPKNCSECRFEQPDYGYCAAMPDEYCGYTMDNGKPDWCPLEPIVTCGECRHWKNHGAESTTWTPCMDTEYSKDFFCGRAERKDSQQ